ncbi:MAG: GTPase [Woeseiaceae bacterium]|jgi:GTP-binding protein EngB required for normal cell division|nr:GTPase [Woeseiaceae bacterium]
MKVDRVIRSALAIGILLVLVIAIAAVLFLTESALNVWERLAAGPAIILYGYLAALGTLVLGAFWLIWRFVVRRNYGQETNSPRQPLSRADIESRLREADELGVAVGSASAELEELAARQAGRGIQLCFFGEISTGKSSLIRALVPDADVEVDVRGGSTDAVRHYRWQTPDGTALELTDVPGIGGHEGLDDAAVDEARRAHVVLFVCDSDLTRAESAALGTLLGLDKPVIVVLNKADRYTLEERAVLVERLLERLEQAGGDALRDRIVAASAGSEVEVIERHDDGTETVTTRRRGAELGVLIVAINRLLAEEGTELDQRRERAVFQLAADKLSAAQALYRTERAEQIIRGSTRKAVIGALAAVSPGTDILIQGYIGTAMTRSLCKLYGAEPRDLDVEEFLSLSQSRVGRALPLTLAVAGNGLKAFPGLGTVAGGLVHAVAYGLIFDALGRSLVLTLSRHGELDPEAAAKEFEETISEHIEAGAKRVARLAVESKATRE